MIHYDMKPKKKCSQRIDYDMESKDTLRYIDNVVLRNDKRA